MAHSYFLSHYVYKHHSVHHALLQNLMFLIGTPPEFSVVPS